MAIVVAMTEASTERKESRLNIRASARQRRLIREAAAVAGKTVTGFVLDSACETAEQLLADRRRFVVDDVAWARFLEALDRPVTARPRLRDLLETPGVFDRR